MLLLPSPPVPSLPRPPAARHLLSEGFFPIAIFVLEIIRKFNGTQCLRQPAGIMFDGNWCRNTNVGTNSYTLSPLCDNTAVGTTTATVTWSTRAHCAICDNAFTSTSYWLDISILPVPSISSITCDATGKVSASWNGVTDVGCADSVETLAKVGNHHTIG
jgi:hypothetical protein